MITNLFASLALPMTGWCASPNGCTPKEPVPAVPAENVTNIGTIDRANDSGEDFAQRTIDNTVDSMMSTVVWELAKIGILIVLAVIAFVVIKKLMKSGADKARAFAEKMKSEEILKHRREQREQYTERYAQEAKTVIGDKFLDEDQVLSEFQGALKAGRSFYETEMSKQDNIHHGYEESLSNDRVTPAAVSIDADGLTLSSLNETVGEGIRMMQNKPLDELYPDYSKDLSMESLLPTDLNAINAVIAEMDMPSQQSVIDALNDIAIKREEIRKG